MIDVVQIEIEALLRFFHRVNPSTKSADLSDPCDPRPHPVTGEILDDRFVIETVHCLHLERMGPRPHDRHGARDNVEQLRQLVEAGSTQESSHSGDAWIAPPRVARSAQIAPIHVHGAKLQDFDGFIVEPVSFLLEEGRAAAVHANGNSDKQDKRPHQRHQNRQHDEILNAFLECVPVLDRSIRKGSDWRSWTKFDVPDRQLPHTYVEPKPDIHGKLSQPFGKMRNAVWRRTWDSNHDLVDDRGTHQRYERFDVPEDTHAFDLAGRPRPIVEDADDVDFVGPGGTTFRDEALCRRTATDDRHLTSQSVGGGPASDQRSDDESGAE